jgi:hypothetical protein
MSDLVSEVGCECCALMNWRRLSALPMQINTADARPRDWPSRNNPSRRG